MDMKKIQLSTGLAVVTIIAQILLCTPSTTSLDKPQLNGADDMAAVADDTVWLNVTPVLAPVKIRGYLWSFDGGKSYTDTTESNMLPHVWKPSETGTYSIAVRAWDSRLVYSDPVVFHVTVSECRPALSIVGDTLADVDAASYFSVVDTSVCGSVHYFIWSFDGGASFPDTSRDGRLSKRWSTADTGKTVTIAVRAPTGSGQPLTPAFLKVHVGYCRPAISLRGDSIAFLTDSTRFYITSASPCAASRFLWSFGNGALFTDTTVNPFFIKQWTLRDTGARVVFAAAQTGAGIISAVDTFRLIVRTGDFRVTLPRDTTIWTGDTLFLTAQTFPAGSTASYFVWSVDGSARTIWTEGTTLAYPWTQDQAGLHTVSVKAVDAKGRFASGGPMTIIVASVRPTVIVPHDTLVRSGDTIAVTAAAQGGVGKIVRYLWNVGGLSWTDSGDSPHCRIWRKGHDSVSVMVGARDENGNLGIDSFHVFFNAPPQNLRMLSPKTLDTVCLRMFDSTFFRGAIPFSFSADDPNGVSDSLTYRLCLGKSPGRLDTVYTGKGTSCSSPKLDTGDYFWTLSARDRLGDSAFTSGSFACILQQTVCFAGHSIIVGMGVDPNTGTGGLRKKVLSELRKQRGGSELTVRATGPLPTGYLSEKKDDSCFAISSFKAQEVVTLMQNSFPNMTADIWVVMLGVNGQYTVDNSPYNELKNIFILLDNMYRNNPLSATFVINGIYYSQYANNLTAFNDSLNNRIQTRRTQNPNRKIWTVDAYGIFSPNGTVKDSLFNPADNPLLHPNQRGYDSLAQAVLDTMKAHP
jgi:hypothetical protein